MRGIPSLITDIRKKVFTEVARMAYEGNGIEAANELPYKIVPGDRPLHRESVFLERAIAKERVRLAMGLSPLPVDSRHLITEGMDAAAVAEQYYEPPLINIISYACHACPTNQYKVTKYCQNCLARSCEKVCPKGAIEFENGRSHIDQRGLIICLGNRSSIHTVGHQRAGLNGANAQTHSQAHTLTGNGTLQEDRLSVQRLVTGYDLVGQVLCIGVVTAGVGHLGNFAENIFTNICNQRRNSTHM